MRILKAIVAFVPSWRREKEILPSPRNPDLRWMNLGGADLHAMDLCDANLSIGSLLPVTSDRSCILEPAG
jgi:hypothetical protein